MQENRQKDVCISYDEEDTKVTDSFTCNAVQNT